MASSGDAVPPLVAAEKIYSEIRTGIRETDSISFKLMGLVPLVSGSALLGLMLQSKAPPSGLVILLALFAALVTLGLFRWELRNIQTCSWLISYAEAIEARALKGKGAGDLVHPRPSRPQGIGKTEAEKLIYFSTMAAWLALPVLLNVLAESTSRIPYYVAAGVILAAGVWSLLAETRVPKVTVNGG